MVNTLLLTFLTLWVSTQRINCDPKSNEPTKDETVKTANRWNRACVKDEDCEAFGETCIDRLCSTGSRTKRKYDEIITDCPEELTILLHYKLKGVTWVDDYGCRGTTAYNQLEAQLRAAVEDADPDFLSKVLSIVFEKSNTDVIAHIRLLLAPPKSDVQRLLLLNEQRFGEDDALVQELRKGGLGQLVNSEESLQIHRDTHPQIGESCDADIPCSIMNSECSKSGKCECTGEYIEIPGIIDQCYKGLSGECKASIDCENPRASCINGKCWIGSIRKRFRRRYDEIYTDCEEGMTILITLAVRGIAWNDNLANKDSAEYANLRNVTETYIDCARIPYMKKILSIVFEEGDGVILIHIRFLLGATTRSRRSMDRPEELLTHEQTVKQFHIERKLARAADTMKLALEATEITVLKDDAVELET